MLRCCKNARQRLREHPENSGDYEGTLRVRDCEKKVCFPS
jgi:hypothetical protein